MNKLIAEKINARAGILADAQKALDAKDRPAYDKHMAEAKNLAEDIEARQSIEAEAGRFADEDTSMVSRAQAIENRKADDALELKTDRARSGNAYAQAFAYALKNGITPKSESRNEKVAPLFNALTQAGGSPVGADGGFLVPVDMDNMINEVKRALNPLSSLFDVQSVSTSTGWRVKDNAPTKGFTKLTGELTAVPADDQPAFAKVNYSVDTYGLYVPMSQELLDDEVANLMAYLARWIGKKEVITENTILLSLLGLLSPTALTAGKEFADIKKVLNVTLDPAIVAGAQFLTNQTAFDLMDQVEDANGHGYLREDITNAAIKRFGSHAINVASDAFLKNTGTTPAAKAPIYVGDFAQYGTLFRRKAVEISGTNVGGDAWRNNGYELKAITRLGASVFDDKAVKALNWTH